MTDPRHDYLAAYRRSIETPAGVRNENLQAVLDRAAAIEDTPAEPTRWAAALLVLKISSVAVVGAGLGWAGLHALEPSAERPEQSLEVAERPQTAEPPILAEPSLPAAAVAPPIVEPAPVEAAPPQRARAVAKPEPKADQLREELALLESARAHLRAGNREKATRSLSEHARRFPQGNLSTERTAWRAIVACSGSDGQPKAAARSFILTHGDTPLAAKVKAECGL